jgi:ABC-type dipeptide/oligopeptide/nickel transport system permease subunit
MIYGRRPRPSGSFRGWDRTDTIMLFLVIVLLSIPALLVIMSGH